MVVLCCTIQIPKFQILEKYVYNFVFTNIMCLIQLFANFQNTKKIKAKISDFDCIKIYYHLPKNNKALHRKML